jgi:mono/diheme cytochrome c family protein
VLPVDVATNTLGEWVVVTAASSSVQTSWAPGAEAPGDAGLQPFAFNPLFMSGQPVAVVARGEQWVVFEREPAAIAFFTRQSFFPNEVPLPGASMESTGHRLFHQATFANIACASCHPEAGDDEHVWQFSEGARRTPTLRGGLAATAPFHWSGDEASMSSLVADVMVRRMSGNAQTPTRAEALLDWLDRQPRMDPPPTDAASVARGQALFASADAQCASCHTGPLGTNNATLDVHTGGSFQVPRLAELGWRTQWFHDGRIATPADRFGPAGGGDAHGHTSQLSAAERADLLEYLKSR